MKHHSIQIDIHSNVLSAEASAILQEFLAMDHFKNDKELLRCLGWFTVGMLARAESEQLQDKTAIELQDYITNKLHPYTIEDAVLNDLWEPVYWGMTKSPVKAAEYLRIDLERNYDDPLVKSLAQELLYGRGTNLLKYNA